MRMIKKLEDRYARATTCHVSIKDPGGQLIGRRYEINLHLVLSDRRTAGKARTRAAPLICVTG